MNNVIINVADLKNPKTGKTYREENNAMTHNIPINALVEVLPFDPENDYGKHTGCRLFVVSHDRDCDGTPLYSLSFNKAEKVMKDLEFAKTCVVECGGQFRVRGEIFINGNVIHGFSEDCLMEVR